MSEATPEATPTEPQKETAVPEQQPAQKGSLEDTLSSLDEGTRSAVIAEFNKTRSEAKNLRERVKSLEPKARQFEALEEASRSDLERAQADLNAANQRIADAFTRATKSEIKAALATVVDDPDSIVEDLNIAKFVDPDGNVDADAVSALKIRYGSLSSKPRSPRPDASQASSGNGNTTPSDPKDIFAALLQKSSQRAG